MRVRDKAMPKWSQGSKVFGIFDRNHPGSPPGSFPPSYKKVYGRLIDFYYKDKNGGLLPMERFEEGIPLQEQRSLLKIYEFYFQGVGFGKWTEKQVLEMVHRGVLDMHGCVGEVDETSNPRTLSSEKIEVYVLPSKRRLEQGKAAMITLLPQFPEA
jgi:hypothetical protein